MKPLTQLIEQTRLGLNFARIIGQSRSANSLRVPRVKSDRTQPFEVLSYGGKQFRFFGTPEDPFVSVDDLCGFIGCRRARLSERHVTVIHGIDACSEMGVCELAEDQMPHAVRLKRWCAGVFAGLRQGDLFVELVITGSNLDRLHDVDFELRLAPQKQASLSTHSRPARCGASTKKATAQ
jgi:hypothetical protein